MFNPEKILGGLLMGSPRRRSGLGSLLSSGVAMGLAGVALEAVEHFMDKSKTQVSGSPPSGPPPLQKSPPSPPPQASGMISPPPPPSTFIAPENVDAIEVGQEAVLLIRAMIAAANADGVIDQTERDRILKKLKTLNLSDQEHSFIVKELLSPAGLEDIVAQIKSPEMAKMVYTVSLLAIELDTDSERKYIKTLAQKLTLNESDLYDIHRNLKIEIY